ncbi:hypothetical protein [Agrobacterium pusense]|uniref:hypothetical protein n=1 Tax=Agrobacterium pusense TaxID=648995 RepID=UPI000DDB4083|nr:hypothetical protein [Agrobacterium pusense]MCZ7930344.1 hypothetical protein [Agrobacterium pusense]
MTPQTIDFDALLQKSSDELFDDIGHLTAESYKDGSADEVLGISLGSFRDLGSAIFNRLHREVHSLICGNEAKSEDERNELKKILSLDAPAMCSALTGVLIYYFAVSLPIASLVAVLIVKYAVVPATEEVCSFWGKQLG